MLLQSFYVYRTYTLLLYYMDRNTAGLSPLYPYAVYYNIIRVQYVGEGYDVQDIITYQCILRILYTSSAYNLYAVQRPETKRENDETNF